MKYCVDYYKHVNGLDKADEYTIKYSNKNDILIDFLEKIKDNIDWPEVDILFAPHHGRDSGKVPTDILKKVNPTIIVIGEAPSENIN